MITDRQLSWLQVPLFHSTAICSHNLANIKDLLLSTSDKYHISFLDSAVCQRSWIELKISQTTVLSVYLPVIRHLTWVWNMGAQMYFCVTYHSSGEKRYTKTVFNHQHGLHAFISYINALNSSTTKHALTYCSRGVWTKMAISKCQANFSD